MLLTSTFEMIFPRSADFILVVSYKGECFRHLTRTESMILRQIDLGFQPDLRRYPPTRRTVGRRTADLRAFNLYVGSMSGERCQISNVRSQDGSSGLSARHNKRVDGGPAPSTSSQESCTSSKQLRNRVHDFACLEEPVGVCIATGVALKAFRENNRRDLRRPQSLLTECQNQGKRFP
jgi:hypothetical protein